MIIRGFGGERYAGRIARAIVAARDEAEIKDSKHLAQIIEEAVPAQYRHGKLHPATKTFQAIRMAVNDELGALAQVMADGWSLLKPGGRMVIISFHEHEDRMVKKFFRSIADGEILTKRVVVAENEELKANPRSRSAKLRAIKKNEE